MDSIAMHFLIMGTIMLTRCHIITLFRLFLFIHLLRFKSYALITLW
nr:MAG TPA: hypothetical protein [Caudoviricetes sp.]